jgi:integrase
MPKIDQLTAARVKSEKRPGDYLDGRGLYLQVRNASSKSWLLKYSLFKRAREMGLGSAFDFSLADARDMRDHYRKLAKTGHDPIEHRKAEQAARAVERAKTITFKEAAERFIAANRSGWRNIKHAAQWTATLETYVFPLFGDLPIQAIDTGLILKVLEPIWPTKPETASRVRGRIESVISAAKSRGEFKGENPATWKGHLDKLLPKTSKVRSVENQPALAFAELPAFMASLRSRETSIVAAALEFQILTAARPGNALKAKWSEIDSAGALWVIPGDQMKNGKEHRVPLSRAALAVLARMAEIRSGDFIFFGAHSKRPLSDAANAALISRMSELRAWVDADGRTIVPHGFRSTFRDWAAERGYQDAVAEAALAHSVPDAVIAAYRRTKFYALRKALMDDWSAFCASDPTRSADVLAFAPITAAG